jgi:CubicO group peptidase (beta-lactamase class C family)
MIGAGGIYSNLNDMMVWVHASLYPEQTDLTQEIRLSQQNWKAFEIDGQEAFMGLGWMILKHEDTGERMLVHPGNTYGTSTMVVSVPSRKIGVVVMANSNIQVNDLAYRLVDYLMLP